MRLCDNEPVKYFKNLFHAKSDLKIEIGLFKIKKIQNSV